METKINKNQYIYNKADTEFKSETSSTDVCSYGINLRPITKHTDTKKKVNRYIEKMKKQGKYIGVQRVLDSYVVYFIDQ
jgi:ABC-type amino acid transport substrate-binding protein